MNEYIRDDLLRSIAEGIESTPESVEDAKADLGVLGYDVDAELLSFHDRLNRTIKKHTWKISAREKIQEFHKKLHDVFSWRDKSDAQLDDAIAAIQGAGYATAFRNLDELTRDEKIAILEDFEALSNDAEKSDS